MKKHCALVDLFRSAINQIKNGTNLEHQGYNTFPWAEIGTETIKQIRMKNIGNRANNIIVELDDLGLVHDMFLSINRWKNTLKDRGRFGDNKRDIKKALDIIKFTIGDFTPGEPESYAKVQKSKYEMMDRCNALNKQDFNAVWGCNNYEEYRNSKPGTIWDRTSGFMKLFGGTIP